MIAINLNNMGEGVGPDGDDQPPQENNEFNRAGLILGMTILGEPKILMSMWKT